MHAPLALPFHPFDDIICTPTPFQSGFLFSTNKGDFFYTDQAGNSQCLYQKKQIESTLTTIVTSTQTAFFHSIKNAILRSQFTNSFLDSRSILALNQEYGEVTALLSVENEQLLLIGTTTRHLLAFDLQKKQFTSTQQIVSLKKSFNSSIHEITKAPQYDNTPEKILDSGKYQGDFTHQGIDFTLNICAEIHDKKIHESNLSANSPQLIIAPSAWFDLTTSNEKSWPLRYYNELIHAGKTILFVNQETQQTEQFSSKSFIASQKKIIFEDHSSKKNKLIINKINHHYQVTDVKVIDL